MLYVTFLLATTGFCSEWKLELEEGTDTKYKVVPNNFFSHYQKFATKYSTVNIIVTNTATLLAESCACKVSWVSLWPTLSSSPSTISTISRTSVPSPWPPCHLQWLPLCTWHEQHEGKLNVSMTTCLWSGLTATSLWSMYSCRHVVTCLQHHHQCHVSEP